VRAVAVTSPGMREATESTAVEAGIETQEPHALLPRELVRQHRLEHLGDAHWQHGSTFAGERRKRRWAQGILELALRRAPIPAPSVTIGGFSQWAT
jgi:hypothetical protein